MPDFLAWRGGAASYDRAVPGLADRAVPVWPIVRALTETCQARDLLASSVGEARARIFRSALPLLVC